MPKLTQAFVESLPANRGDQIDFDPSLPGFGIRTTAAGKKLFIARARVNGQRRVVSLGEFLKDFKTVTEARNAARTALDDMREGKDPILEREARKRAAEAGAVTIGALADRWLAEVVRVKRKPRTVQDYERLLDQKIRPAFGEKLVSEVSWEDVNKWHAGMAGTPRRANYAVATLKALMNFAELAKLRAPNTNPCRKIQFYAEGKRERFLDKKGGEIAKAAEGIAAAEKAGKIGPHAAAGLRLALFTGARGGEITAIEWSHINWERCEIRLPDSKTNTPRTIYLNEAALQVLIGLPRVGRFVIAGAKKNEPYKNLKRAWIVARTFGGLHDVRLHDLRHSFASLALNEGESLAIIGKLLGHKHAATTQRYAHLARDVAAGVNDRIYDAMKAAIEKPVAANVVKFKRKGRGRAK